MRVKRLRRIFTSMLSKYIVSYVIVLIVPLLVLGYMGYVQLKETIGDQVRENQQQLLYEIKEDVDQKWVQMNVIASRLGTHPMLTPYAISDYFHASYGLNPFVDHVLSSPYLKEIVYYLHGHPYMYASVSTYPITIFTKDFYRYSDLDSQQLQQQLDTLTKPVIRPAEEVTLASGAKERLITYMVPIPYGSSKPHGAVMFLIEEANLIEYNRYMTGYNRGGLLLFDSQKQQIASHVEEGVLVEHPLEQLPEHAYEGVFSTMTINDEEYYYAAMESDSTGWSYIMFNPVKDEIGPMTLAVEQWFRKMLMILVLGGALIFVALYYNYSPVHRLVRLAGTYLGKAEEKVHDLELVRTFMDRTVETNRQLDERIKGHQAMIKQHMLLELLKGDIESLEEWNSQVDGIDIPFSNDRLCVLAVEVEGQDTKMKQQLQSIIERQMADEDGIEGYCRDTLDGKQLIVILAIDEAKLSLASWLDQLHAHLQYEMSGQLVIGVGKIYEGLQHAGKSWIEASTAVDYKLIRGSNKVIYFAELGLEEATSYHYPKQELEHLKLQIKQGQTEQVSRTINKITQVISENRTTLVVARCFCYDFISAVKNTVHELTLEHPDLHIEFPDIWTLMDFTTVEELSTLLIDACINLTEAIGQSITNEKDQMIYEITEYVQQYCTKYDFSIQQMADGLHVSTSYLSRYYKEKTGSTLSELVNQIRIEEAKKLLTEKDDPVKDIILQIGYTDPSSFTRKFKATVGMTPGEYRKLHGRG